MLGNFMGDYVKGNKYTKYLPQIQKGILLHRKIDFFTDHHELVRKGKRRLNDQYHKYSGIVMDIFYDHFLAINWDQFHQQSLSEFASDFHKLLLRNYSIIPSNLQMFTPFFIANKRLTSYATIYGIEDVLKTMSKHTSLPNESTYAIKVLEDNYSSYNDEFMIFFNEIIDYVSSTNSIRLGR
ncbi:MAG: ACP phosphodiesterase [Bacteroidales bacterium]|nr:ACP phosphodiesterase [Bacteroidales bacterium]